MTRERPVFIDPVSTAGEDVGDAPIPRWLKLVAVLVVGAAGFYGFSYPDGPSPDSNHTFLHGSSGEPPAATSGGAEH